MIAGMCPRQRDVLQHRSTLTPVMKVSPCASNQKCRRNQLETATEIIITQHDIEIPTRICNLMPQDLLLLQRSDLASNLSNKGCSVLANGNEVVSLRKALARLRTGCAEDACLFPLCVGVLDDLRNCSLMLLAPEWNVHRLGKVKRSAKCGVYALDGGDVGDVLDSVGRLDLNDDQEVVVAGSLVLALCHAEDLVGERRAAAARANRCELAGVDDALRDFLPSVPPNRTSTTG